MASLVARAPVRLDFGGGWTDVPPYSEERGGCVCSAAIELFAIASVEQEALEIAASGAVDADSALARAVSRRSGIRDIQVRIRSEFPVGAGLGGSSAAGVAAVGALAAWRGVRLAPAELAEASRLIEVEDLGIAGGRQDHYAAAIGGVLGLWFGDGVTVRSLAPGDAAIAELESRCAVAYTGRSRISGDTITGVMNAYRARDRHVLGSLDRMRDLAVLMVDALGAGDVYELAALVGEHWQYQRELHPAIPTPDIDRILADAASAGAAGGKALGASGGGCVLAIASRGREEEVRRAVAAHATLLPVRLARRGFEVVSGAGAMGAFGSLPA